jgi:hypothetical protein
MDSRILGIVGGVLLIIGVFCPLVGVDFMGQSMSVSYIGSDAGTSWEGLLMILLGIASIALAVLRKYKLLLVPGIIALAIVAYDYFSFKSKMSEMVSAAGSRSTEVENAVSMKWGWIVLILGAIALLIAGATGRNHPAPGAAYGAPPPPPYTPGR